MTLNSGVGNPLGAGRVNSGMGDMPLDRLDEENASAALGTESNEGGGPAR